jgi:hypothetical protein
MFLALLGAGMMWCAQRLPISRIPEQLLIALVRDDVIDDRGSRDLIRFQAHAAQGLTGQVHLAQPFPARIVSALPG